MFADSVNVDGLIQDWTREPSLFWFPYSMRAIAAGIHLCGPEVRLEPNPFLLRQSESWAIGPDAQLAIKLIWPDNRVAFGVQLGDSEHVADNAG